MLTPHPRIAGSAIILLGGLALLTACSNVLHGASAHTPGASLDGSVDVRMCGAVGDGQADDGLAIRAAVARVRERTRATRVQTTTLLAQPELCFPPGIYRITNAVDIGGVNVIRGHNATVIQDNPAQDVFVSRNAHQMLITGMTFSGGRTHLAFWNANVNMGHIVTRDCRYCDSQGPAIHMLLGAQSTDLVIDSCIFRHCEQALETHTDYTMLRDCWIQTSPAMRNKAVIVLGHGKLALDNLIGVPLVNGADQRWIDCHGDLNAFRCRFGGEGGGFTPVVNWGTNKMISLRDCTIATEGNALRKTAVFCEAMPRSMVIRECDMRVPPLMLSSNIDLTTCFLNDEAIAPLIDVMVNRMPAYTLPEGLRKPIVGPRPLDKLTEAATRARLAEILTRERVLAAAGEAVHPASAGAIMITPSTHVWDLTDRVDTLVIRNEEYLAVAEGPAGTIIMRRAKGGWPHIYIRGVEADLATHPVLAWRTPFRKGAIDGASYTVKIIDRDTQMTHVLQRQSGAAERESIDLRAFYQRERGNVRFDIKLYYLGIRHSNDPKTGRVVATQAEQGDYMVVQNLCLEAAGP